MQRNQGWIQIHVLKIRIQITNQCVKNGLKFDANQLLGFVDSKPIHKSVGGWKIDSNPIWIN